MFIFLSIFFQYKLVDTSNIRSIIKIKIIQVKIYFINERTNLNAHLLLWTLDLICFLILDLKIDI
jgi:hypothetical protein